MISPLKRAPAKPKSVSGKLIDEPRMVTFPCSTVVANVTGITPEKRRRSNFSWGVIVAFRVGAGTARSCSARLSPRPGNP